MVRWIDSASGLRLVVSAAEESSESPGSLPASRAGGDCSSACQEATSFARRAMACSSAGLQSAAPGICALAASCSAGRRVRRRGWKPARPAPGAASPVSWCCRAIQLFVGGRAQIENRVAADGRGGKTGHERQQRLPLESGEVGVHDRRRNGIEQRASSSNYEAALRCGGRQSARSR